MIKWKLALPLVLAYLFITYSAIGQESIDFVLKEVSDIGFVILPKATSFLPKDQWGSYSVDKIFDGELETSWSEGVEGTGIEEKIAFLIPRGAAKISIVPGYGVERLFFRNNHVKEALLDLYLVKRTRVPMEGDVVTEVKDVLGSQQIAFQDIMEFQTFPLNIDYTSIGSKESALGVMTIKTVYEGTHYDDTCIAEITFAMSDQEEAVLQAVRERDSAKLHELSQSKQNFNFVFFDGRTPLQIAVDLGYEDVVRFLLENNDELDIGKAIINAVESGNENIFEMFINAGADIRVRAADSGETPLHVAIRTGVDRIALWLIENNANLNVKTSRGFGIYPSEEQSCAPIHYAAQYGNPRILRKLIDRGVDTNIRTDAEVNYTPLHYAVLHFAEGNEAYLDVVRILLEEGAIINSIGGFYQRETPYEIAIRRRLASVVKLMDEIGKTGDEYINYIRSEK